MDMPDFEVCGVITQPDRVAGRGKMIKPPPVKIVAQEYKLPVFQPENLRHERDWLEDYCTRCDLAVVVAFGQILPRWLLSAFKGMILNIHSSLLPRWRGAAPMQRAIMAGDTKTGVTLMKIIPEMDAGPIYVSSSIQITEDSTFGLLHDELSVLGAQLLRSNLLSIVNGSLQPESQPLEGVTYAKKIDKSEAGIDWNLSAVAIKNLIHGLSPSPGAYCIFENKRLKILQARVFVGDGQRCDGIGKVSKINFAGADRCVVGCGCGAGVELVTVQLEGRGKVSIDAFIAGHSHFVGSVLGVV
jgi:methionyl-tRNA formyltransferase